MENIEQIVFKSPTWTFPFYKFISNRLNLEELEKIIFNSSELENILDEEVFIDLVSFNFKNNHCYNEVRTFIFDAILTDYEENQCKLFGLICDYYKEDVELKINDARSLPEAVLKIFDQAKIEVNWLGEDNPASSIHFLLTTEHIRASKDDCRTLLSESAVIIGYAHNRHIELIMDGNGNVYFFISVINELYSAGSFFNALTKLLLGLDYGEMLCSSVR